MKIKKFNTLLFPALLACFLSGAACNLTNSSTNEIPVQNQSPAQIEAAGAADTPSVKSGEKQTPEITSQTVSGSYRLNTYKAHKGGQDNTLDIEDKGNGKLRITILGSNVWYTEDIPQMHEGGGEGDAQLKGTTAIAKITSDGGDRPCTVTITFSPNQAKVAVGKDCSFNVALDGVYTREKPGRTSAADQTKNSDSASNLLNIEYAGLRDFVNEHQKNKTGKRFNITEVPANKISIIKPYEISDKAGKNLFYFQMNDDDGDVSTMFVSSAALIKSLKMNSIKGASSLRATAVLVEFLGEFDVYRSPFVTRIEGLDEAGNTLWAATGPAPVKTKFQQ